MDCTDYRTSGGHSGVEFSHPTSEVEWSQRWRETKFTAMEEIVGTFTYKHNYDLANRVEVSPSTCPPSLSFMLLTL